ncbi:hypothetical protein ARMGADRAFT_1017745 [Armillaria gallica]|uniref:Secreted protein n=1 Tax=Armillaria gallica TaxID=47427 RepID=A0A2H3CW22_ARMGA|nr:hypothetical protein ARMGADRAFT_1017745 [Armillaria gallica]
MLQVALLALSVSLVRCTRHHCICSISNDGILADSVASQFYAQANEYRRARNDSLSWTDIVAVHHDTAPSTPFAHDVLLEHQALRKL